jgi:hypothetical protein
MLRKDFQMFPWRLGHCCFLQGGGVFGEQVRTRPVGCRYLGFFRANFRLVLTARF